MSEEREDTQALAQLAAALGDVPDVDHALQLDALDELHREGRISYMGARERRLARERAVAAIHVHR